MKFVISYHNHASSNVLLDFAATFSLPAINQSSFCLFVNQSSTRVYQYVYGRKLKAHILIYMHLKFACKFIEYCDIWHCSKTVGL